MTRHATVAWLAVAALLGWGGVAAQDADATKVDPKGQALAQPTGDKPTELQTLWDLLRRGGPTGEANGARPRRDPEWAKLATTQPEPSTKPSTARKRGVLGAMTRFSDQLRDLGQRTNSNITPRGQHKLGFHVEKVQGSQDSYQNANYFGRKSLGGAYSDTDLTVEGKVFGIVNFRTHYSDNMYGNPYDNTLSLNYATRRYKVDVGDIQAGVQGNSLVEFSRSLKGVALGAEVMPKLRLSTLYSKAKAQTRTILINGANRSGPYYAFAGQVVDGSQKVRVNNRDMVAGEDYTFDTITGELNFLKGLIIQESDVIAITFEVYGTTSTNGVITGWRGDYTGLRAGTLGFSYLTQGGSSGAAKSRTQQFYGYNSIDSPYQLDEPVDVIIQRDAENKITGCLPRYPMTVTVGSLPQVYGTDYFVDPLIPNRVYFRLAIPSTQLIRIAYTPVLTGSGAGNRAVMGLDSKFAIGKLGTLVAEMATSSTAISGGSIKGSAWQIRNDMSLMKNRLHVNTTLKNIGNDFTSVESVGFRRNDRGVNMTMDYAASKELRMTGAIERTRRPAYDYSAASSTTGYVAAAATDNFSHESLAANWQLKKGKISLTHNKMSTLLGLGGSTSSVADMLTFARGIGKVAMDLSVGRTASFTHSTYGSTTGTTTDYGNDALVSRLNLKWAQGERLSLESMVSNNILKNADGKNSNAIDLQLQARMKLGRGVSMNLGVQRQDSGGYSSSYSSGTGNQMAFPGAVWLPRTSTGASSYGGYVGGYNGGLGGFGNYSGGFYGGGSYYGMGAYGGKSKAVTMQVNYQPANSLTVDLNLASSASEGDYLYNSRRHDATVNVAYTRGEKLSLNTAFTLQNMRYIGSEGGSTTALVYTNARFVPVGKLVAQVGMQMMRTNSTAASSTDTGTGNSFFGSGSTNVSAASMRLEYPVWRGNNLFLDWSLTNQSGYLASTQRRLSSGIVFDLMSHLQFTLGWRMEEYITRDTTTTGNFNYRVNSIDADLGVRF